MKRYICIHGHFYQPPRENPWLETIEFQDSAAPYHDWNERIAAECYGPNAHARILDREGMIERIVNNYERISFNFGPTLLSWLEIHAPGVYTALKEADRRSRERFGGHGSALAQVYNHMIMPLATPRDKRTQILWGIEDFRHRFERAPEGMWLAETAVDTESLELLAAHGIAFTILAPHQARRMREAGAKDWIEINGAQIDPTRAYRCNLPSGRSIALLFYDGPISQAIAFQGLLDRGENLVNRLMSAFDDRRAHDQLVHVATDGETFGHHHRFGEMALAWALEAIETGDRVELTNYGQYLELHPPAHEVQVHERTAWSCAHGVGRWERDCGCNSGNHAGWNQQWRAPLRAALDWLRAAVEPLFESVLEPLVRDPWAVRDRYVEIVLDRSLARIDAFLDACERRAADPVERIRLLKALEMQRNAMLMYTSCGWFFDDLGGIETVQVLRYAARVVQLAGELSGEDFESPFLERLAQARGNLPQAGDGRAIWRRDVLPVRVDLDKVAAHYGVTSLFRDYPRVCKTHSFAVERLDLQAYEAAQARLHVGRVRVTSDVVLESETRVFAVLYFGGHNLTGGVCAYECEAEYQHQARTLVSAFQRADLPEVIGQLERQFQASAYSLRSLFRDEQRWILEKLLEQTVAESESAYRKLYEKHQPLVRFFDHYQMPVPRAFAAVAEFALGSRLRAALEAEQPDLDRIEEALNAALDEHVRLDAEALEFPVRRCLERLMRQFESTPRNLQHLERCERMMRLVRRFPFPVDLGMAQNIMYRLTTHVYPETAKVSGPSADGAAPAWFERFNQLGQLLGLRVRLAEVAPSLVQG